MLVRVQPGTGSAAHGLSGAEAKVHDMLAGWAHGTPHAIDGLALLNVNIPDKSTTRQIDGLLFLPTGLAVLEVKGFTTPQAGMLTIPPNGPWLVEGEPAAIHTLAGLPNPGEQVKAGVYAAKRVFADIPGDGDSFIRGLVVLAATGAIELPPGKDLAGYGIDVALAQPTSLRKVLHRYRAQAPVWTADGVVAACAALALVELAPSRAELLAEGFSEHLPAPPSRPEPPIKPPISPPFSPALGDPELESPVRGTGSPYRRVTPPPLQSVSATTTTRASAPALPAQAPPRRARQVPASHSLPPSKTPPPPPPARPETRPLSVPEPQVATRRLQRRVPWGLIVVLALISAIGITAAIIVGQVFHGS
ncbi:nuclease-related domain-containing protein [Amycolatopsis sp. WQ 127309]|uniref:nuclease-related domain-containing protein n=1 Tax=Amycolatopsis sp. WQ 127309 TaxID=2932773 RepID=UPI001FF5986C|nr:nuclease-related domain-containing protein [Amycolatopsis sp. WQ 127309]UOZ03390.1 NERD domain-containing protein [Amycolatopsis sp. WQ 127309]